MNKKPAAIVPHLLAFLMIAVAFHHGLGVVSDVDWPPDHDQYRELASARSLLAEGYGHDPYYQGESIWYNPLTHVTLGLVSRWTGLPLELLVTRGGAFLNLLAPVSFYLMAVVLLGEAWLALPALAAFLFCMGNEFPSWATATYSPWLYPGSFTQAFFYAAMAWLALNPRRSPPMAWAAITGLLWGLIFLGHTSPALLFAGVLACLLYREARARGMPLAAMLRTSALPGLALAGIFLLVAWPFLQSLLGYYRLHIVNDTPTRYVPDFLGLHNLPAMAWECLKAPLLLAWLGLYALLKDPARKTPRGLLLPWLFLSFAGLGYGYACVTFSHVGLHLPQPVPSFHFLLYLKAALALLFALGVRACAHVLAERAGLPGQITDRRVALALTLALAVWTWPDFLNRIDHVQARAEAISRGANEDGVEAYRWTLQQVHQGEVILASDDTGLFDLAPAGAKLVAVNVYFSNPYVDWAARDHDRELMFERLASGKFTGALPLLRRYDVAYVAEDASTPKPAPALLGHGLTLVFQHGNIRIYSVDYSKPPAGARPTTDFNGYHGPAHPRRNRAA